MGGYVKVATTGDLAREGKMKVEVDGHEVALFRLGDDVVAIDDECTHVGGSLSEGTLEDEEVECPWHGARFNVRTGEVTRPPAMKSVKTYAVKVEGEDILIRLE